VAQALINARAAAREQMSGVERWAVELSERLPVLRPAAYAVAHPPPGLAYRAGQAWEQTSLPLRARRRGVPLILSPANLAPLTWPGNIVVIHDAVALSHPEWFSRSYAAWQRRMLPATARRARRIITVSAFSRDEIASFTGVDDAILVVAGGVDERFGPDADADQARQVLGLDGPYVLTVAGVGARKNLAALATSAKELKRRGIALVSAGSHRAHHGEDARVPSVRALGYVDDALLPGLYAGASAFVLPSLHEGFGLPCIEAMASGVAVVAANRGALPQTCGDAAWLVNPESPGEIADALLELVDDGAAARRLRSAGLSRAAQLSWDATARAVDRIVDDEASRLSG